jgi:SAM-dependent methyltransferase
MSEGLRFDEETARRIEGLNLSPDAIRRRSCVLQLLAPRSGERILDIGCGPGFLASELAAAVGPTGSVLALDTSESMLQLARARCAGRPWATVRAGDAQHLDVGGEAFDAFVSVQVHEYVKDVGASLEAAARALLRGGRALVVATDWDSIVWHAADPERMRRVLSAFEEHLAHVHLPRRLGFLLTRAGLELRRCEVIVQLNQRFDANNFSHGLMELIQRFVPGRRGVSTQEADAWADDLRELGSRGEYFFSLNQYVFVAARA